MNGPMTRLLRVTTIVLLSLMLETRPEAWTAQAAAAPMATPVRTGADVYEQACAVCHGRDGRGAPRERVGFDLPLPDFTDCAFTTPEPDLDWLAVAHDGGPARAFDRRMPAFGTALSPAELQLAISHIRTFCTDPAWPRGELNLPRPLVTEKAFPENEAVLTTTVAATEAGSITHEFLYERRFGPRSQVELALPLSLARGPGGSWQGGVGDLAVGLKHAWFHSLAAGRILSVAGEVVLPTGETTRGFGKGVAVFEPFVAFGQLLPRDAFVQAQVGFEFPFDRTKAEAETFVRAAVGRSLVQGRFGRTWTPMVEVLGVRELVRGEALVWDAVPQMQVTLSRRQHVMVNLGVRLPVNERRGRTAEVMAYLLWDWFDGGLFDGWR